MTVRGLRQLAVLALVGCAAEHTQSEEGAAGIQVGGDAGHPPGFAGAQDSAGGESSTAGESSAGGAAWRDPETLALCEAVHVDDETTRINAMSCWEELSGDYTCVCDVHNSDFEWRVSFAGSCEEAMAQACGAVALDYDSCRSEEFWSGCHPAGAAADTWICVCSEGDAAGELHQVEAPSCRDAAEQAMLPICSTEM